MYITAASTISHQPTFRNKDFFSHPPELNPASELITPDYSEFIPAMDRRRMSDVVKMSIACAMDCLQQTGLSQPDAIMVGTSMGCPVHTRNFLDKIFEADDGPVAPTSFIVSTHNTIAGQISLLLKTHGYNMTHTQNSLSFEQALLDGMLCLGSGCNHVLAGGADEDEERLYNMKERLNDYTIRLTCGASFFILSNEKGNAGSIKLIDVGSFGLIDDHKEIIIDFLKPNNLTAAGIDLVLYASTGGKTTEELDKIFGSEKLFDYQKISGVYFTNPAFAMHFAVELLLQKTHPVFGKGNKTILVYNNIISENLGLILLTSNTD